jgi:peptide/nickel transport system permease protein
MIRFVTRRALTTVVTLFVISVLTFLIFMVIPAGDPVLRIAGRTANPAMREQVRKDYGFDDGVVVQYARIMDRALTGRLTSYSNQTNVWQEVRRGIPATASLVIGGTVLSVLFGGLLGLLSARWAGSWPDRVLTIGGLIGVSLPAFWLGAMLLYVLTFKLRVFPPGGYVGLSADPWGWLTHMVLPWCTLAALNIGVYSRVLRGSLLGAGHQDYVRTARAKGVAEGRVLTRHVLRSALIPLVTVVGLDVGVAIGGGAILIESVFGLQGVGQYAADSIGALDVPSVMGTTIYAAFLIVVCSALVDIAYAWLDPRVRTGRD